VDGAVLVENELIVAVGRRDEVLAKADADIVELAFPAATILPGLINAHVHLAFNSGPDRLSELMAPADEARLVLAMAARAQQLISSGVTTVRDLGARGGLAVTLREAINAGELVGSGILAATAPLTPPAGHRWFLGGEVAGAKQFRQRIQHNAAAGADVIKMMVSGGCMTPGGRRCGNHSSAPPNCVRSSRKLTAWGFRPPRMPMARAAFGFVSTRGWIPLSTAPG
jgi:imidazolonepropionase-like amidohydrolase